MHRADKGTLNNSLLKILSNAENNFLLDLKLSGLKYTRMKYKPEYFRTLKRRLKNKYNAALELVYQFERLDL